MPMTSVKRNSHRRLAASLSGSRNYRLYYYVLAGFNLLTIGISVWSAYQALEFYRDSLHQGRAWSERSGRFTELANLVAAVNAPGNDIFRSGNVEAEADRLSRAWDQYQSTKSTLRDEASQNVEPEFRDTLLERIDRIHASVARMKISAESTLQYFARGRRESAAREMAVMDAHLTESLAEIGLLNSDVTSFHTTRLEEEELRLAVHARLESLFFGTIVLAVLGVTIGGRQLLRKTFLAEQARATSEMELRGLLGSAVDAIITISEMGVVESFNPAAEKMFGYRAGEIIGQNISRLMPAPYRDEHDGYLANYRRTGERRIIGIGREAIGRRQDGSEFPLELSISEWSVDGVRTFTGIVRNITARKQAEQTLLEAQAELQAVFDSSPVGMCLGDKEGRCRLVNAKFEAISGFRAEDMFGEQWVNSLHPEDRTRVIAEWYNAIGWSQPFESEHRLLRADGRVVWTNVKVATIRSGETTIGFVGTMEDVTDRREAELKLQKNNLELQAAHSRLEEQTAQLGQQAQKLLEAHERAEQANRSKSEFLANMSHEIRTPMTAILGYADMLYEDGNINSAPESRLNAIRTIQRNGLHLLGIINDILDLSKIEAGKLTVEFIECSPKSLVDDVLSLMKVRSQAKGIALVAEYETPVPDTILSDPTRIRQILMNLVGNAIKFTEIGKVRLQVRFVKDDPSRMEFDVVDTGIGMTEEQRERLFRPFSQADNSMSRQFGGTGLGLTISKRLATMLGGDTFIVHSQPGAGTRFRFSVAAKLPDGARLLSFSNDRTDDARSEQSSTAVRQNSQRISGCRILLAEDSPDNQRLITYILKKEGAEVTVVENGELAVEQATEAWQSDRPFDVILMDMQMPVLDGYTATSRLRAQGYTLPIIALTAHTMASDRQKCIDAGCDDHSPKPINREKLMELITSYCETSRRNDEEVSAAAPSGTLS